MIEAGQSKTGRNISSAANATVCNQDVGVSVSQR